MNDKLATWADMWEQIKGIVVNLAVALANVLAFFEMLINLAVIGLSSVVALMRYIVLAAWEVVKGIASAFKSLGDFIAMAITKGWSAAVAHIKKDMKDIKSDFGKGWNKISDELILDMGQLDKKLTKGLQFDAISDKWLRRMIGGDLGPSKRKAATKKDDSLTNKSVFAPTAFEGSTEAFNIIFGQQREDTDKENKNANKTTADNTTAILRNGVKVSGLSVVKI